MKTQIYLLLILAFTVFSCNDDEGEPIEPKTPRVSQISEVHPSNNSVLSTYQLVYNAVGLLDQYSNVKYSYNGNGLLDSMVFRGGGVWEEYTYDAAGRMTTVYFSRVLEAKEETYAEYRFFYDNPGRITHLVGGFYNLQEQVRIVLSYDPLGNMTKQEGFLLNSSGEVTSKAYSIEVSYDTYKNPFKGVGSPISRYYLPYQGLTSNFPLYLSPNNPVEAITTTYPPYSPSQNTSKESFTYKYNELGFPIEVRTASSLFKLDYSLE